METTVTKLGFTPLKGTRHTAYDAITLDAAGPVGDREWCLVEPGAARVLRTINEPLLATTVEAEGDHVGVTLGDGRSASGRLVIADEPVAVDYWGRRILVTPYDGEPAGLLAEQVGRPVRLARAGRGDVVFGAPVSLLGTASVRDLATRMGRPDLVDQSERFRSTMLVETDEPWVEDSWVGHDVRVGETVVHVTGRIGRCGVPNRHPVTALADAPVLKALAGYRPANDAGEPYLAVDAVVVTPGVVRLGDVLDTP
ncbi:MOSC domain-containing protein [Nocardioides sp. Root151]|uniref:MOSC domain-containing protein n=1 Tax=Nocardioides sp. Root151 TaxID=1736475 RepID=UPI000702DC2E|nr:MOSC domain-containing protein [Nocardioides sp. Root151]KQZ70466.1 hypothetical protein ASD66_12705 [Nocardioides sp. Root151]